jgi:hypothetical protein
MNAVLEVDELELELAGIYELEDFAVEDARLEELDELDEPMVEEESVYELEVSNAVLEALDWEGDAELEELDVKTDTELEELDITGKSAGV